MVIAYTITPVLQVTVHIKLIKYDINKTMVNRYVHNDICECI